MEQLKRYFQDPQDTEEHVEIAWWITDKFAGSGITKEQFIALYSLTQEVHRICDQLTEEERANKRFSYQFFNEQISGFAKIEPDQQGNLHIQIPNLKSSAKVTESFDLNSMNAEQFYLAAHKFKNAVIHELATYSLPALDKYMNEQVALEQHKIVNLLKTNLTFRQIDWPRSGQLEEVVKSKSLDTFNHINTAKGYEMVRALTGLKFTDKQLYQFQLMVPDLEKAFRERSGSKRVRERYSISMLSDLVHGLGELQVLDKKHAVVYFHGLKLPVDIQARGDDTVTVMTEQQILQAAATIRHSFNEQVAEIITPYIEAKLPEILGQEEAKQKEEETREKDKIEQKFRDAMGADRDAIDMKYMSGVYQFAYKNDPNAKPKRHPEFKMRYTAKNEAELSDKIGVYYPAFKQRYDQYVKLLSQASTDYGFEFQIGKDDITADLKEFDMPTQSIKDRVKFNQADGLELMSWMRSVYSAIDKRDKKRRDKFLLLESKGLKVERVPKSEQEPFFKYRVRNPKTGDYLEAPLVGNKGIVGKQVQELIRYSADILNEREPEVPKISDDVFSEQEEPRIQKKTELVFDNVSLGVLSNPRAKGPNDTFLPLVHMAKMIPEVERVAVPSIVADFESRGMMPGIVNGKHFLHVVDTGLNDKPYAKAKNNLFANAMRIRVEEDGTEIVLKEGDPKLVVYESPMQDAFYAALRKRLELVQETGASLSSELRDFREGEGKDMGENAIYDYCRRSKHKPVIITDDTNSIDRRMFVASSLDRDEKLQTPDGIGIGFSSTRGFVRAVQQAYEEMAPVFVSKMGAKENRIDDVSPAAVSQLLKKSNNNNKIDQEIFDSESPDYIAGHSTRGRSELQLLGRFIGKGRSWLVSEGYTSKEMLSNGWNSFVKNHPYLDPKKRGVV